MKNTNFKNQEQKPSISIDSIYAPAFADYNHEINKAFLFRGSH